MRRWPTAYAAIAFCTKPWSAGTPVVFWTGAGRRARELGVVEGSLERDDFSSNHPALSFCWSMISGQTLRTSDRSTDRSDIAALDLLGQGFDQLRHFFKVRVDGERLPECVERALFVADVLHDHAEPRQRTKMARFADQYLLDVLERMGIIVLQII